MTNSANDGSKHLPLPSEERRDMGLRLSGGGFRAALFHLGALRRLNELGILSQMGTISSVSGGSIVSGHLAATVQPWPGSGQQITDWEATVAAPFHEFVSRDIRTHPVLKRFLPWNWFRTTTQVKSLAAYYHKDLIKLTLAELPERPKFIFCATDLVFGVNWIFERDRVGDYQAGYFMPQPSWPVADAIAASSCFPPVFGPWAPPVKPDQLEGGKFPAGPRRDTLVGSIRLSDGGVYDNMGTEPVWKDHKVVVVSDGGAPFQFKPSKTPARRISRYLSIVGRQSSALRKRWLIANFKAGIMDGTYWGIAGDTEGYPEKATVGYSKALIEEYISRIRTDLDCFNEAERAVLENHGYILADAAATSFLSEYVSIQTPLSVPYPEWMDEIEVAKALKDSDKRRLLGRDN